MECESYASSQNQVDRTKFILKLNYLIKILVLLVLRLFLLASVQSEQRETLNADNLESNTGKITDGVTLSTETSDQDFIVFRQEVQATILGDEGSDLFTVLLEEDSNTLSNSGVGLFGFDTDLFGNDTLSMRSTHGRILISGTQHSLVVRFVSPPNQSC